MLLEEFQVYKRMLIFFPLYKTLKSWNLSLLSETTVPVL